MSDPTPYQIIETLLPHLRTAAAYSRQIQARIQEQPEKDGTPNFFAAALSDADLSVQTFVEVALLGNFPQIRFFGEEHEKTYNTKYFKSIALGEEQDYLVTLDPIDGTRFYLDGHPNYQIILTVLNRETYEAVIAISPAKNEYFYGLHKQGCFRGSLDQSLQACAPLTLPKPKPAVLLSFGMQHLAEFLGDEFQVICVATDYAKNDPIPNVNGLLSGDLCGVILAAGNWIDGGAIAFLAQEAGYRVSDLEGKPLPPLHECQQAKFSGIAIAATAEIHQSLLQACQSGKSAKSPI